MSELYSLRELTSKQGQASSGISIGHKSVACATGPSLMSLEDSYQTYFSSTHGSTSKKMRNSKVDLGPHASIVVQEWKLLSATVAASMPLYVDNDYLGIARITAASK